MEPLWQWYELKPNLNISDKKTVPAENFILRIQYATIVALITFYQNKYI